MSLNAFSVIANNKQLKKIKQPNARQKKRKKEEKDIKS